VTEEDEEEGPKPRRRRKRPRHLPDPPIPEDFPVTRCPTMYAEGAGRGFSARPTGRVPSNG
jgi:hypothetical protein